MSNEAAPKKKRGPRTENPCRYCKQEVQRPTHGLVCEACHNDWKRREKYDPIGQLYSLFLFKKRMP
jgi:hypothetical protein